MSVRFTCLLPLCLVCTTAPAHADVVLNEVVGSTTGADAEFVELYNRGDIEIDIGGWRVGLWDSDAGRDFGKADGASPYRVPDGITLAPGGYFLFANPIAQDAFMLNADVELPANAIENSSYTIVLSDADAQPVDSIFVSDGDGDDAANIAGTLVTPALVVGPRAMFLPAGFTREPDGGDRAALLEFEPVPPPSATPTGNTTSPFDGEVTTPATIMQIQGSAHVSPLLGTRVRTSGVVTAVAGNGFYLQDPTGDDDIATADALFVFTNDAPTAEVGEALTLVGRVAEFVPGGADTGNLSTTQLADVEIEARSPGTALPDPVAIGSTGRVPPARNIDDDAFASFDPNTDGIDFFESLEAMRVMASAPLAIAPTNRFGELFTVVDLGAEASGLSDRQTLNISPDDFNPEKVQIDPNADVLPGFAVPDIDAGTPLDDVTGVVSYGFGNFEIVPTETFSVGSSAIVPDITELDTGDARLTIATYNVLNLDPNDSDGDTDVADGRFDAVAAHIVTNLAAPAIVGLQEIQDNDGAVESEVASAAVTLQRLVDAIAADGGPRYAFADTPGLIPGAVGGQPGGNIRVAFLYDPDRVELMGEATPLIDPVVQARDPSNPFFDSRIPLAADFRIGERTITVVNNHLSSKGGSAPIFGVEQPFDERQEDPDVNGSLDARQIQAAAVAEYVDTRLAEDENAAVVVLGDLNEFEFVSPLDSILGERLINTTDAVAENERYTFIFQGNSQSLDHILVSESLAAATEVDVVHVNAEFLENEFRASDHDPILVSIDLEESDSSHGAALDLDRSGTVDRDDYRAFLRAMRQGTVEDDGDARADFDGSGNVDRQDLERFVIGYGEFLRREDLLGDLNRDGNIDRDDAVRLVRALGTRAGRERYDPDADLNADGRIGLRDVRSFIAALDDSKSRGRDLFAHLP